MAARLKVVIDCETRSQNADVTVCGPHKYSLDPTTVMLCWGYQINGERHLWRPTDNEEPKLLIDAVRNGALVFAHNVFFEWCIWNNIMVPYFGWPPIPESSWRDTMAQGNAIGLPNSLEDASMAAHLTKEKNLEGRRVMLQLTKPRAPSKLNPDLYFNDEERFGKLYEYCLDDCEVEDMLEDVTFDLHPDELEVWQFDRTVNARGCYADRQAILATLELIETIFTENEAELAILTDGKVTTAGQRDRIIKFFDEDLGFKLPGLTADIVERALSKLAQRDTQEAWTATRILQIRQENGKSSTKKFLAMLDRMDDDDRIRGYLQYCGAFRTGRWAGRGIQPQNFPRGEFAKRVEEIIEMILARDLEGLRREFVNPMSAISTAVRGMLMASPGHDLIAADYNAIEGRGVFWLAGCETGLEVFRSGRDPYKDMASAIFGTPYNKVTDDERFVGKQAILGLGYQMGHKRFMGQCESYGHPITEELAKRVVNTYRERYVEVKDYWADTEAAALQAVRTGKAVKCGHCTYFTKTLANGKMYLFCRLPKGRCIGYPDVQIRTVLTPWGAEKEAITFMGWNNVHQWDRISTHGGVLVENQTQAVCRDLLAFAMLNLEERGYPIVIHIHDESVSEVLKTFGSVEEYCEIMEILPKWAKGFPVKAEGWRGKRYRKG